MCEKQGSSISEAFARGLNAISEDKGPRFSAKSKEVKSAVAEGLS
jgi:hypothetical protein